MTEYKIVAFDMDGTLLNHEKQIHPQVVKTLIKLQQNDIQIILATGRHHSAVRPYSEILTLTTPTICCNGSYLYDFKSQRVLDGQPMAREKAIELLELIQKLGLYAVLYLDDVIIYQRIDESLQHNLNWANTLPLALRPNMQQSDNLVPFIQQAEFIWKFSVGSDDLAQLSIFAEQASLLQLSCERSWFNRIDVANAGNNKGNMLRKWVESQGNTLSQVIAFGDNENDIAMLQAVGEGIAMGNSELKVQHSAKRVIGDNNSETIATTLPSYFPNILG